MSKMEHITSISELINRLHDCDDEEECKKLVKLIDIPLDEYGPYMHFSSKHYTRNCIARTDRFELLLLCWEHEQETPIHCHNEQECWVYVVEGSFAELRYSKDIKQQEGLELKNELSLNEERISYMNDDMGFHSLINTNPNGRSMSLHLYMSPIDECRVYNEGREEFELKELEYYSYQGKILQKEDLK